MTIYDSLCLPDLCSVNTVIDNALFFKYSRISKENQALIDSNINKFTIKYNLNPKNTGKMTSESNNISFTEIEIVEAQLNRRSVGQFKFDFFTLARVIFDAIPYPMLLIFNNDTCYRLLMSFFHTGKIDESKNVIENIVSSDWIDIERLHNKDRQLIYALNQCYKKNENLQGLFMDWNHQLKAYSRYFRNIYLKKLKLDFEDDERHFREIGYVGDMPFEYYEYYTGEPILSSTKMADIIADISDDKLKR